MQSTSLSSTEKEKLKAAIAWLVDALFATVEKLEPRAAGRNSMTIHRGAVASREKE